MFKIVDFIMDSKTHKWERIEGLNSKSDDIEEVKNTLLSVPSVERVLFTLKEIK